jgi:hypothetical protein
MRSALIVKQFEPKFRLNRFRQQKSDNNLNVRAELNQPPPAARVSSLGRQFLFLPFLRREK